MSENENPSDVEALLANLDQKLLIRLLDSLTLEQQNEQKSENACAM